MRSATACRVGRSGESSSELSCLFREPSSLSNGGIIAMGSGKYAYCLGDDVNPNTVERNAGISLLGIGVVLILVCGTYTKVQFWRNRWARRKRDAEASAHSFTYNHVNTDANDYDYSATAT